MSRIRNIKDLEKVELVFQDGVGYDSAKLIDSVRYRVFYDVSEAEHFVKIIAVGHKVRNRLFIGGEEFEL